MENNGIQFKIKSTFDSVIKYWPKKINVDSVVDNPRVFLGLSTAWDEVEEVVGFDNPWEELMVWVMFCVLHEKALESSSNQKVRFIYPNDIPFSLFLKEYQEQLDVGEWRDLKNKFKD